VRCLTIGKGRVAVFGEAGDVQPQLAGPQQMPGGHEFACGEAESSAAPEPDALATRAKGSPTDVSGLAAELYQSGHMRRRGDHVDRSDGR